MIKLKKIFLVLCCTVLISVFITGCVTPGPDDGGNGDTLPEEKEYEYFSKDFDITQCSFYDKFEGTALNPDKWVHQNGDGSSYGVAGWGNNEQQWYQPENATVQDGILTIAAKKETGGTGNRTKPYTSSKIVTNDSLTGKHTFSQTYGRFEAKVRLTRAEQGIWPAFWMMPKEGHYGGWPRSGEIDIMEMKGRFPKDASSALHFGGGSVNHQYVFNEYQFADDKDMTEWHIFGVDWDREKICFTIDGKVHQTFRPKNPYGNGWNWAFSPNKNGGDATDMAPFDRDFYILMNLAVGGQFDGNRLPSDDVMPIAMQVEFIRAYTLDKIPYTIEGALAKV